MYNKGGTGIKSLGTTDKMCLCRDLFSELTTWFPAKGILYKYIQKIVVSSRILMCATLNFRWIYSSMGACNSENFTFSQHHQDINRNRTWGLSWQLSNKVKDPVELRLMLSRLLFLNYFCFMTIELNTIWAEDSYTKLLFIYKLVAITTYAVAAIKKRKTCLDSL